jgi:glutamate:GABA antiporter
MTTAVGDISQPPLAPSQPKLKHALGLRDFTLFAIAGITAARWIPFAARAGPTSVTLWLLAALLFVVPLASTVAALVAKYPGVGGLYLWTSKDFGPWNGFLAFWLYWIGIAFQLPTTAILHVKVPLSLLGPVYSRTGENRIYLLTITLALVWVAIGTNLVGMKIGRWTENIGCAASWALAGVLICVACLAWARRGSATQFHLIPHWDWTTVSVWAAIAYATSGMECAGMMAGEIHDPERTIRRAGWMASAGAMAFYVSATIAFLVVLPPDQVSELNGYVDFSRAAGTILQSGWLPLSIAVLFFISGVGALGSAGTACSRLPFAAGVDGLLPKAIGRVHPKWGTPHVAMLTLGIVSSFLLIAYQLGDTMRAAFDELISTMVITGFIPFFYIFGSAWKARKYWSAASGLAVTCLALISALVPSVAVTNVWLYEGKIVLGTLIAAACGWLIYRRNGGGLSRHSSQ